jgi:hypothetical protein
MGLASGDRPSDPSGPQRPPQGHPNPHLNPDILRSHPDLASLGALRPKTLADYLSTLEFLQQELAKGGTAFTPLHIKHST